MSPFIGAFQAATGSSCWIFNFSVWKMGSLVPLFRFSCVFYRVSQFTLFFLYRFEAAQLRLVLFYIVLTLKVDYFSMVSMHLIFISCITILLFMFRVYIVCCYVYLDLNLQLYTFFFF